MVKKNAQFIKLLTAIILTTICLFFPIAIQPAIATETASSTAIYQQRTIHNPDGIGKFYMGREIAKVMGYEGAGWLERPSRGLEERSTRLVNNLDLKPTDIVADIGAGTGYFSFRIAPLIPQGKVLAVDVQPEMLNFIESNKQEKNIANVEPVLASFDNPNLPENSINLALMVDAYHEFAYPREMMQGIVKALKPEGRVVSVEYRGENPLIPIKGLHKMTQKQVKKEMAAVGLVWKETKDFLPLQHLMVFEKQTPI
ncbi:MAG: methyltransferase domain-containing protein [Oscillatoriaceae cyanobacterium Prado104]|jgi:precorrin-6B methylase 2|nr:methyltransferase domain-containing protein [Oscillatoriaceae cyanobacterium Prado104]